MRLPKDYAAPKQEETAVEYIWEQRGCVQQRREPIVRCRDCKFGVDGGEFCAEDCADSWDWRCVEPNGFCAWGERKADA